MEKLTRIKHIVLDMDGTVFLSNNLLPGAAAFIDLLNERGISYNFLTNNSSKHRGIYAEKLRALGLDVTEEMIFTSGEATTITLRKKGYGDRVYLMGTPELEEEFRDHGFILTDQAPDVAVLGFDQTLTYAKFWKMCDFVRDGLPYIATHPDFNCPIEGGWMPDTGAMIAFIEAATGRRPDLIVGKPYTPIIESLVEKVGYQPDQLLMIGDRLYTDIALGKAGIMTILVLSGESQLADLPDAPHPPDLIMRDLAEVKEAFKTLL